MNRHAPIEAPATHQDVLGAPEGMVAEAVRGVRHTQPRRAALLARAATTLGAKLDRCDDDAGSGSDEWRIVDEPVLHPGEDILMLDMAGWRRWRMPVYPGAACSISRTRGARQRRDASTARWQDSRSRIAISRCSR